MVSTRYSVQSIVDNIARADTHKALCYFGEDKDDKRRLKCICVERIY